MVLISSFDPVRRDDREARVKASMVDGRRSPASIEGFVNRAARPTWPCTSPSSARRAVDRALKIPSASRDHFQAARALRFRFPTPRTSSNHSIEVARLLHDSPRSSPQQNVATRGRQRHDSGKVDQANYEGSHASSAADSCALRRDRICRQAVAAHHAEVEAPRTIYDRAGDLADAIPPRSRAARAGPMTTTP